MCHSSFIRLSTQKGLSSRSTTGTRLRCRSFHDMAARAVLCPSTERRGATPTMILTSPRCMIACATPEGPVRGDRPRRDTARTITSSSTVKRSHRLPNRNKRGLRCMHVPLCRTCILRAATVSLPPSSQPAGQRTFSYVRPNSSVVTAGAGGSVFGVLDCSERYQVTRPRKNSLTNAPVAEPLRRCKLYTEQTIGPSTRTFQQAGTDIIDQLTTSGVLRGAA